jgi:hypothetical protein
VDGLVLDSRRHLMQMIWDRVEPFLSVGVIGSLGLRASRLPRSLLRFKQLDAPCAAQDRARDATDRQPFGTRGAVAMFALTAALTIGYLIACSAVGTPRAERE